MSEATSDYPLPRPAAPLRRADRDPPEDPRLAAALSLHNPVFPLDPPLEDVRIPVNAPHAAATRYSCAALMRKFPGAQVGDDLHMLFSEPGRQSQSRLAPDVSVALNVPRRGTRSDYDADVLGPPDFILEVLSRSTWEHDLGRKLDCYQRIGVRECLLFDVNREALAGAGGELWGYALTPERRAPFEVVALPNGERGVRSEVLGLVAYVTKRTPPSGPGEVWALTMRWHDLATGKDIPDYEEAWRETRALRASREAAERETRALRASREAAERETRALRASREAAERETQALRASREAERRIAELEEQLRRPPDGP